MKNYTDEEIKKMAHERYGSDPNSFGGQRDGFIEGFKHALSQHDAIILDGCLTCKNNLPTMGMWCANNCIKGSMFESFVIKKIK